MSSLAGPTPAPTLTISTSQVTVAGVTNPLTVIRLEASVPYDPVVPGMIELLGFSQLMMRFSHEQGHIGGD